MRAALYARVSTNDQTCENQLLELRRYCQARGWTASEYVDTGVSGSKDRRPGLDQLMTDAKARHIDMVVCWRLDRFSRSLRHLVVAIEELTSDGVGFVSVGESIDTNSAAGRLLLGVLGSFAEFERERIKERIQAGLQRARRQRQSLGRRRQRIAPAALQPVCGLSVRQAAKELGVPPSRVHAERLRVFGNSSGHGSQNTQESGSATAV
jgi:putative DNA-invertase from lambdoid prophage Rac